MNWNRERWRERMLASLCRVDWQEGKASLVDGSLYRIKGGQLTFVESLPPSAHSKEARAEAHQEGANYERLGI